jgi:hypothetical protein
MAYRGSPKNRFEKAKKANIKRLLDVGSSDGEAAVLQVRYIDRNDGAADPVTVAIKQSLSSEFEIIDPNPDWEGSMKLVRRN